MHDKKPGFLRQIWSKNVPWYAKVARTSLAVTAGLYIVPQLVEQLPGEALPEGRLQGLESFYGETLDYSAIRLHSSAIADVILKFYGAEAITCGKMIVMQQKYDELLPGTDGMTQYVLAHELGHVRQHDKHSAPLGLSVLWQKLVNLGNPPVALYEYSLKEGKNFAEYGIEQQASILADYYNISNGQPPLLLTDKISGEEREQLYRTVLADFLRERAPSKTEQTPPAPVPSA